MRPPVGEVDTRPENEILDRRGDEDAAVLGDRHHARGDVDGKAANRVADELDLARVQADADRHSELAEHLDHASRARDRAGGTVEDRQKSVAGVIDLPPPVGPQVLRGRSRRVARLRSERR